MIGTGAKYYRVEIAISDPRQALVYWRPMGVHRMQADAISEARKVGKDNRTRVIRVDEECVWANEAALVAVGAPVK